MDKYKDIEKLLEKLAKENPDEMDKIDDIDEAVFERIEYKALYDIEKTQKQKTKIWSWTIRVAAGAVAVFAVFSIALYFIEIQSTRAKNDVNGPGAQTSEQDENNEYKLNVPTYIPEGYQTESIEFKEKDIGYFAEYKYTNPSQEGYYIFIRVEGDHIRIPQEAKHLEEFMYNSMPFTLSVLYGQEDRPDIYYADFSDKRGLIVQIEATVSKEEIIKIADSIG